MFTVVGATLALGPVIGISDSMILLMSLPNVLGLNLMARIIRKEIAGYRAQVSSGEFARVS